jgi:hypothetical protein
MSKSEILNLIGRIKSEPAVTITRLDEAAVLVRRVFPKTPEVTAEGDVVGQFLHMIDVCLPGWTIQLTGKATEPDGHWRCSLRETRGSDEVEVIGLGAGRSVDLALLEALLHVAEQKAMV